MTEPQKTMPECKLCGEKPTVYEGVEAWCSNPCCPMHGNEMYLQLTLEQWVTLMTPPLLVTAPRTEHEAKELIRIGKDRLAEIENEHKIIENGLSE